MRGGIFRPCTPARPLSSFLVSQSFKIERSGSVKKLRGIVFFAGAFLILSNLSQPARAQTATSGTVIGTVTDPSGAAVLDAAVVLRKQSTHSQASQNTNGTGQYRFG